MSRRASALPRLALPRLAVLAACAVALSGCVSLLPKSKPSQLYRFGVAPAPAAAPAAAKTVGVMRAVGSFQRESASDRLLTVTGAQTAFIERTRWVAPAQALFDEAVLAAFDTAPGRVRLVSRGEPIRAPYALRLDVRNFETQYLNGPEAAPTVVVRVRAVLMRDQDRSVVAEQFFDERVPAADNRVSAIVPAYDQAVTQVLSKLTAWVDSAASPVA